LSFQSDIDTLVAAFDDENLILYVKMHQMFSLALVPFHHARVALTTVLYLTTDKPSIISEPPSPYSESPHPTKESQSLFHGQPTVYRISSQEDYYQPQEFVKFLPGFGILHKLIVLLQYWATFLSVLGVIVGYPVTVYLERRDRNKKTEGT
jgi:hypothetical protein